MRKLSWVSVVGVLLACFGTLWLGTIYKRCEVIAPAPRPTAAANGGATTTPPQTTAPEELVKKIRSPYAKDYHFILFWILVCLEAACALGYLAAGLALGLKILSAKMIGFAAIASDVLLKLLTAGYMIFCATPLAQLTKNENVLIVYFYADKGFWDWFSGWVSGIMVFQKGALIGIALYVVFIGSLFYFYRRLDAQRDFS